MNDHINKITTILSTKNLMVQLFFIPSGFLIGFAVNQGQIGYGLYGIVGWLFLGGICLAIWELYKVKKSKTL